MRLKKVILLFALGFVAASHAQQLVQFQPGTPAKAAEVNQNFALLKQGLDNLASFENLTEAQILQLQQSLAVPKGPSLTRAINCQQNAGALMEAYASIGEQSLPEHVHVTFEITGSCHAALVKQYPGLFLTLRGIGTTSTLIPHPQDGWTLLGGFNGGLTLWNLTLRPPANATGVLISRASQGSLFGVTIEGGATGVMVQSNGEATLSGAAILNTTSSAIAITTGGVIRYFGGNINQISTPTGAGVSVDSGHFRLFAELAISAPNAVMLVNGASFYSAYPFQLNGSVLGTNGSALLATDVSVVGNISLEQSDFLAVQFNHLGFINLQKGSQLSASRGQLSARVPFSASGIEGIVLGITGGSSANLGTLSQTPEITVDGSLQLSRGSLTLQNATANVVIAAEQSSIGVNRSQLTTPSGAELLLNTGSSLSISGSELQTERVVVNNSTLTLSATSGSANFYGKSAQMSLLNSDLSDSFIEVVANSTFDVDSSKIAGFYLGNTSSGMIKNAELSGNFSGVPFTENIVSASAHVEFTDTTFTAPKSIQSRGILSFNGTVDLAGSNLQCSGRSFAQYWQSGNLNAGTNNCSVE